MEKQSILIIDDDGGLRKTLSDILSAKGYETIAAKDGSEGLGLLTGRKIDLALIDLRLPDISGIEVLNRLKTDSPSTEAIILTGNATLDSAIAATNKGAFSYLQKPYEIDQLMLHIRRAIEKRQAAEEKERLIVRLQDALAKVKTLSGLLPICASCKKIRNDGGYWKQIEDFISEHSDAIFSHGICPDCEKQAYKELHKLTDKRKDRSNNE